MSDEGQVRGQGVRKVKKLFFLESLSESGITIFEVLGRLDLEKGVKRKGVKNESIFFEGYFGQKYHVDGAEFEFRGLRRRKLLESIHKGLQSRKKGPSLVTAGSRA